MWIFEYFAERSAVGVSDTFHHASFVSAMWCLGLSISPVRSIRLPGVAIWSLQLRRVATQLKSTATVSCPRTRPSCTAPTLRQCFFYFQVDCSPAHYLVPVVAIAPSLQSMRADVSGYFGHIIIERYHQRCCSQSSLSTAATVSSAHLVSGSAREKDAVIWQDRP